MAPPDEKRRDQDVRSAILRATRELFVEVGYRRLTVEGVARRAGAGKQTIYRWWPSLHAVVIDTIVDSTGVSASFPSTGDLHADLRSQLRALVKQMNSPLMLGYTGLIGAAQSDPALADELYRRIVGPRVHDCETRIKQAQADGEIRTDVRPGDVVEQIYAPLYYRLLLSRGKINNAQVDRILDLAFHGLRTD